MKYKYATYTLLGFVLASPAIWAAKKQTTLNFQVLGVKGAIEKNITQSLSNAYKDLPKPLTSRKIEHFYAIAPQIIKNATAPYGYFSPTIKHTLRQTGKVWLARFNITPGQPIKLTQVSVTILGAGKTDNHYKKLLTQLPLKKGEKLNTNKYGDIKTKLFNIATSRGYFKATIKRSNILINLPKHTAKIIIDFDTGARYRFGPTTFSKAPFSKAFLKKFLTYRVGHLYTAQALEATQEELVSSNYFNQVIIKPLPKKMIGDRVPIMINLLPRKAKTYTLGIGYGTDTGIRGTAGVTFRHLTDWGHRFNALLRAAQNNSSFIASYTIPGSNPAKEAFTLSTGASNLDQVSGKADNLRVAISYTRKYKKWKNTFTLAYLNERYNITNLPRTTTELVYPTFNTTYFHADHPRQPTKGISLSAQLTGASKHVLSRTDFFQGTLHIKTLYTIKSTHTRLLFRTDIGHTVIKRLEQLPLSLQLFAGGARSVRGYSYNAIGPGRNLLVLSAEIQQRVKGAWYIAFFGDAGNVSDQGFTNNLRIGIGPGVAWLTPIGPLELTVANAITEPKKPWMIQFSMGAVL